MEGCIIQFKKLWRSRTLSLVLSIIAVAFIVIELQISSGSSSLYLLSIVKFPATGKGLFSSGESSVDPIVGKESSLSRNPADLPPMGTEGNGLNETREMVTETRDELDSLEEGNMDDEFVADIALEESKDGLQERSGPLYDSNSTWRLSESSLDNVTTSSPVPFETNGSRLEELPMEGKLKQLQNMSSISRSTSPSKPVVGKKNKNLAMGVLSMSDMDHVLNENHGSSHSMKPRWPSNVDQQMLYAKKQIQNAPIVESDQELYAPAFRNLSMFKRSYELMEQILKVYVYKEGERPIFHKPPLSGIYASEGWFMKQMEENTHFIVRDGQKAHLFYMPFSSRMLQEKLYIADSHNHKNMIEHLKNYVITISAKHPFWNRTGGADHFLAACHDWATKETGLSMSITIRALCIADVQIGFVIGKDVSLPETYVANEKDPLRHLGGKPAKDRTLLAFFAGQMHGYLRPILVRQWENKDPTMVITGIVPSRIKKKTRNRKTVTRYPYLEYMKDSKYCICPRGYEVNSPRVVEAIFYGCVPVIISDNFVPPFFEVLNWSAFSVVMAEKDVPRLKEVLAGIPNWRYLELERGVRGVRRHFLWNKKPLKYDLFHMILHSIWFNRLRQIQV